MERVTRNILRAAASGDVIIRHLVLPGHLDCCTKPALEWMARNLPRDRVLVNAMGQYRPDHLVLRRPGASRPTPGEIAEARRYAGGWASSTSR